MGILKKPQIENNKVGGLPVSDSKTYYKPILIETVWCWHKDRHRPEE
jgi:hypothetical protein